MKEDKMSTIVQVDRLSSLPDDLIHKILSFIGIKCVIQAGFLSSRWRYMWTSIPYLNFSSEDFRTLPKFSKFVTHVLSRRNNQVKVSSVELSFRGKVTQVFVKRIMNRIMNYAFSHNVQQLTLRCFNMEKNRFPPSLFASQSLKHLSLNNCLVGCSLVPTSTWDLPALTTLHVSHVDSRDDSIDECIGLFSKCANLKNLTFKQLYMGGTGVFSICHPRLSNLTLENVKCEYKVWDVVAPQLENLTIKNGSMKCRISAPDLSSFHYEGNCPLHFYTDGFHSLEKVSLCLSCIYKEVAPSIVVLLQHVHNTKFLRLNSEIVEFLSSSPELLSHQPSPFDNLKSLKIYPLRLDEHLDKRETMSTEVRNYLLDNSPSATITMVSRKEIRAAKNAKLAQKLIEEVQVLLDTSRAHKEREKAQAENLSAQPAAKMQVELRGRMAQMKGYWEDLRVQIEQGEFKTCDIFSKLLEIEGLLAKLPACQRAEMQPRFSRMRVEADIVMNCIVDCNFIHCDKKRRLLNASF